MTNPKPQISAGDYFETAEGHHVVVIAVGRDAQNNWQIVYQKAADSAACIDTPEAFTSTWGDPKRNVAHHEIHIYGHSTTSDQWQEDGSASFPTVDQALAAAIEGPFEGYDAVITHGESWLSFSFPCLEFDQKYAAAKTKADNAEARREQIHVLGRSIARAKDQLTYAVQETALASAYLNTAGKAVYAARVDDAKAKLQALESLREDLQKEA